MKNPGKTVLFVEDNPLILAVYQNCLEREGFHVESAEDGLIALEKIPQLKPDLVILDLMLPRLDGLDVLKFIRGDAELDATPVMILSNAFMDERSAKAMTAGATRRLLKTQCTPAKLIEAVHESLGTAPGEEIRLNDGGDSQTNSGPAGGNEALFKQMRASFLKDAPGEVSKIRDHCLAFVKASGSPAHTEHLEQLYQRVRFLGARASLSDCMKIAHLSGALEAMIFETIFEKPSSSPSVLQTVAQAVDCLGRLLKNDDIHSAESTLKARVLIVDDDPACNFVTAAAMKRTGLEAVNIEDSVAALKLAEAGRYDIVLLDINMPGLTGFELCEKIRLLPGYQKTPVIFVTSNGEFQNRARAVLSGGNDLIAKPVSPLELALKTIMHLIDPREQPRAARPKTEAKQPPAVSGAAEKTELSGKSETGMDDAEHIEPIIPAVRHNSPPPFATILPDVEHPGRQPFVPELPLINRINAPVNGANDRAIMKNQNENHQPFDKLVLEVTRIIFGDDRLSEMHLRMTRIALERYNVPEIISHLPETNGRNGSHPAPSLVGSA